MKKKILMLAVAACLIVLSIASSSLAYFTDTAKVENVVFTSGKVDIELAFNNFTNGTKFFPGQTYAVPATVTVANDSEDAYVGAKIVFTTTSTATDVAYPDKFLEAFGLTAVNSIPGTNDAGQKTITAYVVNDDVMTKNTEWNVLNQAIIPGAWDNKDMEVFRTLKVSVYAYAVQVPGFTTAKAALATAFEDANFNY